MVMMVVVIKLGQLDASRIGDGALFVRHFQDGGGVGNRLKEVGERRRRHRLADFGSGHFRLGGGKRRQRANHRHYARQCFVHPRYSFVPSVER
jgi:hypothetical protein